MCGSGRTVAVAASMILIAGALVTACSNDGRTMREPRPDQTESIITTTSGPTEPVGFETAVAPENADEFLEVTIPWTEGSRIPDQFTCRGSNVSPNIAWFDVSPAAVGIAIIMYEIGVDQVVHWIATNLDPTTAFIDSGALEGPNRPAGVIVGLNDASTAPGPIEGYRGPCPAAGTASTYTLEIHALGQLVELPSGTPARDLRSAIELVTIQRAAITAYAQG